MKRFFLSLAVLAAVSIGQAVAQVRPLKPRSVVNLIDDADFKEFTLYLDKQRSLTQRRDEAFRISEDRNLHITGQGFGYLRTNQEYREYHCVLEYKWGEATWGDRDDKARDCGLLVDAKGPDGWLSVSMIEAKEVQLSEGRTGDVLTSSDIRDWNHKSPNWTDVRGFRGRTDIENPVGEWNRLEVVCRRKGIQIKLNGVIVNELSSASRGGYVGLKSEFAECIVRRFELHPLNEFDESWTTEKRSTDMGYSITGEALLPRRLPLSPEESQKLWQIDSDQYEIQIAAAEPVTCDPVDVAWDAQGRMFVAEMGDYPTPSYSGRFLSRIRLLSDTDGDGRMDRAVTWADDLNHVQGLLPLNDGLLVTTWNQILFLKDTDSDDKADVREELFISNAPRHNQLQVSCPRWGLDNAIYLNNGLDGKEIHAASQPDDKVTITRLNLRYDPITGKIQPVTGVGQYGASIDDYGRRFFCSNRNPAMFAVIPLSAVHRNPLAGITIGHEDIQPPGAPVRPVAVSHTTAVAHAGTHTAACGLVVYRNDLTPDLNGNLFVCDPTSQLVTRNRLVAKGASFEAKRIGDTREFLASGDEWSRPVHLKQGPDGALYIVDMYRRFIDHARFFPEAFSQSHYMRAGLDHGRIWRLVPKNAKPTAITPLPESVEGLVAELASPIGWRRTNAHRLLVQRSNEISTDDLRNHLLAGADSRAKVRAMWILKAVKQLSSGDVVQLLHDDDPRVVQCAIEMGSLHFADSKEVVAVMATLSNHDDARVRCLSMAMAVDGQPAPNGAELIQRDTTDVWGRRAFSSAFGDHAGEVLRDLLSTTTFVADPRPGRAETLQSFATLAAAHGDFDRIGETIGLLSDEANWVHFSILRGLNEGLRKGSGPKSLAGLISKPPKQFAGNGKRLSSFLDQATKLALDTDQDEVDRIAALPLVAQQGYEKTAQVADELLSPNESAAIQTAACRSLSRFPRDKVAQFFFDRWDDLPPTPIREAVTIIARSPKTGLELMKLMKAGKIQKNLMPPMTRWSYGRSSNPDVKALAIELFGETSNDRAKVVNQYRAALSNHTGDAKRGLAVFKKATCINCHQIGEIGGKVGPLLTDVRAKPAEALVSDILDPNRAIEERWIGANILTTSGQTFTGLIQADDGAGVTLVTADGQKRLVPRDEIEVFKSTGVSLMPVGMEKVISTSEMADLIAFLKQ